ncbi:hypothetical protein K432DRAFT_404298 [Lepidopterella palustris CBS 459.81]|uniref:Uncharacterized protein n=1 Tax=Lepidopterella palustris CBS 459.81 TaxID=1314670 RepID=A0A8E2JFV9_9PEZI|nr:hypothetical protein K432DRAFT_404298 [Lepidopterella palustris CBS 459.81]
MDCTLEGMTVRSTAGFDFPQLYQFWIDTLAKCPGSSLFFNGTNLLTEAVCKKFTGETNSPWSWTKYPSIDIFTRLITWKLPLFQLVSQFPRPPLGLSVQAFAIAHLLGDPIDSIASILTSLAMCETRARSTRNLCRPGRRSALWDQPDRDWKVISIIMTSYDECGKGAYGLEVAETYRRLKDEVLDVNDQGNRAKLRACYEWAANSLAADRATRFFPIMFSEAGFIGSWVISLLRAAASKPNDGIWVNVEAHSIGFSALYLWVTSAVLLGSVIGVSQTEDAIPRILERFEEDLYKLHPTEVQGIQDWKIDRSHRIVHGGIFSWHPAKWKLNRKEGISLGASMMSYLVSFLIVGSGYLTAFTISWRVPPDGPTCRHVAEGTMFGLWVVSVIINCVLETCCTKYLFWLVFAKDVLSSFANIALLLVFQWGVMNRCSCWTMWGRRGLYLPQISWIRATLMDRFGGEYRNILLASMCFQLLLCAAIAWCYRHAIRVYLQRDDDQSNLGVVGRRVSEYGCHREGRRESEQTLVAADIDRNDKSFTDVTQFSRASPSLRGRSRTICADYSRGDMFELPLVSGQSHTNWDPICNPDMEEERSNFQPCRPYYSKIPESPLY